MKSRLAACFVLWAVFFFGILPPPLPAQEIDKGVEKAVEKTKDKEPEKGPKEKLITLDFNNVELPVFVKFISELTGKNFVIDEKVKGKVTIFSPSKIPVVRAYDVFLSVLELKGFTVVPTDDVFQIVPLAEVP
ncbi:MAG TPA: hypothetical protein VIK48_07115, partial [Candidatus Manganitrophaceae bacterium]